VPGWAVRGSVRGPSGREARPSQAPCDPPRPASIVIRRVWPAISVAKVVRSARMASPARSTQSDLSPWDRSCGSRRGWQSRPASGAGGFGAGWEEQRGEEPESTFRFPSLTSGYTATVPVDRQGIWRSQPVFQRLGIPIAQVVSAAGRPAATPRDIHARRGNRPWCRCSSTRRTLAPTASRSGAIPGRSPAARPRRRGSPPA
jgi:hypothetical protein